MMVKDIWKPNFIEGKFFYWDNCEWERKDVEKKLVYLWNKIS